jgi:hypothetical protein
VASRSASIDAIFELTDPDEDRKLAVLKFGKSRITLAGFAPPGAAGVMVERREFDLGMDADRRQLARHIDREQLFTVLFDELALAYLNGTLYRTRPCSGVERTFSAGSSSALIWRTRRARRAALLKHRSSSLRIRSSEPS